MKDKNTNDICVPYTPNRKTFTQHSDLASQLWKVCFVLLNRRCCRRWLWWVETMSQNCGHQRAYFSPLGDMWAWRAIMMIMMPAWDNSWLVHQSSLAVLPAETSGESTRNGRSSENFASQYAYLKYLKESLTFRKILRHGISALPLHVRRYCINISHHHFAFRETGHCWLVPVSLIQGPLQWYQCQCQK
jgi:hypothetical protein